jgi:arginyl-tRNA synthetase
MRRLDISYDLLTRESDILGLNFFAKAFEQLKESGAVHLEKEGKNKGCWVMPLSQSEEFAGLEDPDKVIVRSDGTVTYVGRRRASGRRSARASRGIRSSAAPSG